MPAELARMRDRMVAELTTSGQPVSAAVAEAMRVVPRHLFLPEVPAERAYTDDAIVTRRGPDGQPTSSSSQPMIMAIMLDQLQLEPGQRVLEIGAGTGYNAALMKYLVGPDGTMVTVDLDEEVAAEARQHLDTAGYPDVTVVAADGAAGYPPQAPYDRIIATVGVSDLAPAWLAQLAPGGRIVVPLDLRGSQRSVAFERSAQTPGVWQSRSVVPCGFMRMRGTLAGPERTRVTGDYPELALTLPDGRPVDMDALARALDEPVAEYPTRVMVGPSQLFDGLGLWLALHEPHPGVLSETGGPRAAALARAPGRVRDQYVTAGVFEPGGFAVLARPEGDQGPPAPVPGRSRRGRQAAPPFELSVLGYGPDGDTLAARLAALVKAWEADGRPGTGNFRIRAYPRPADGFPSFGYRAGEAAFDRPHTRFVVAPLEKG
ncbi:MAG TPA: methyltransferase, FxLD system [Streptosporangiaceae bacterium]|jgi:protein-L-isoaspartate(D-aspartate) O-methyltransferase|nr:methyltransferase, FxLD system [Streptosporangiaceae bacterium]